MSARACESLQPNPRTRGLWPTGALRLIGAGAGCAGAACFSAWRASNSAASFLRCAMSACTAATAARALTGRRSATATSFPATRGSRRRCARASVRAGRNSTSPLHALARAQRLSGHAIQSPKAVNSLRRALSWSRSDLARSSSNSTRLRCVACGLSASSSIRFRCVMSLGKLHCSRARMSARVCPEFRRTPKRREGGGAPRGATHPSTPFGVRALALGASPLGAPLRRFPIPGPRFQVHVSSPLGLWRRRLITALRLKAKEARDGPVQRAPRRGVVMPPGRVPGPPECGVTSPARRRRPPLRLQDRL